jgi:hypothetical protein
MTPGTAQLGGMSVAALACAALPAGSRPTWASYSTTCRPPAMHPRVQVAELDTNIKQLKDRSTAFYTAANKYKGVVESGHNANISFASALHDFCEPRICAPRPPRHHAPAAARPASGSCVGGRRGGGAGGWQPVRLPASKRQLSSAQLSSAQLSSAQPGAWQKALLVDLQHRHLSPGPWERPRPARPSSPRSARPALHCAARHARPGLEGALRACGALVTRSCRRLPAPSPAGGTTDDESLALGGAVMGQFVRAFRDLAGCHDLLRTQVCVFAGGVGGGWVARCSGAL